MAKKDLITVGVVAAVILVVFFPGFSKYQELRSQNRSLQAKISELRQENRRLSGEIDRMRTDVVYVERKAREKMGLAGKGEIVYKITEETQNSKVKSQNGGVASRP